MSEEEVVEDQKLGFWDILITAISYFITLVSYSSVLFFVVGSILYCLVSIPILTFRSGWRTARGLYSGYKPEKETDGIGF